MKRGRAAEAEEGQERPLLVPHSSSDLRHGEMMSQGPRRAHERFSRGVCLREVGFSNGFFLRLSQEQVSLARTKATHH